MNRIQAPKNRRGISTTKIKVEIHKKKVEIQQQQQKLVSGQQKKIEERPSPNKSFLTTKTPSN